MKKLTKKQIAVLERNDFEVVDYTDDGRVELQWYTPAGEDFLVCVPVKDFHKELERFSEDFDIDDHVDMWVQARLNGFRGIPKTSALVRDAEEIDLRLQKLAEDMWDAA